MKAEQQGLDSLKKILQQEKSSGFQDGTVIGGLDRFLQHWATELKSFIPDAGSYSILTPIQRQQWVAKIESILVSAKPVKETKLRPTKTTAPRIQSGLSALKGINKQTVGKLKRLGIENIEQLIYHFPNRHNDFAQIRKVSELEVGLEQTVVVSVWEASESRQAGNRRSTQAVLGDETGNIRAIWFNQPYLASTFKPGLNIVVSGKVNVFRGNFVFESPEYEILKGQENLVHTGRLVPVYPTIESLPQRTLRTSVKRGLDASLTQIVDFLPEDTRNRAGLMRLQNAIAEMHYPSSHTDWVNARRRLAFDELLLLQLAVVQRKKDWQQEDKGIPLHDETGMVEEFIKSLPFNLTNAQSRVLNEIMDDLAKNRPMSRLLQGDVGSGKTVVATVALLLSALNKRQGALIAPTEILAEQHFLTLSKLLSNNDDSTRKSNLISVQIEGLPHPLTMGLLVGSMTKKSKDQIHTLIRNNEIDITVGTHAVLQDNVSIPRLSVAIVDEQHRFGVMQRASIREKGNRPHLLAMSATPIPRSLALTLYGELDISTIDEMPMGRQRIRTRWLGPDGRSTAYEFIEKQVTQGRQAFIVCPLIDGSESIQASAATEEFERLSNNVFPDLKVGLLHGRMSLNEKEEVMEKFTTGSIHLLVSTQVVEVGIDIPNATVMLIDGADRFGLAQLHQLRGRVGRGSYESYCILLAESPGHDARERMKLVERSDNGFELAEEDLRIRGPGDYLGTRQSGLPNLKVARVSDQDILSIARTEAVRILDSDPAISSDTNLLLSERLAKATSNFAGDIS